MSNTVVVEYDRQQFVWDGSRWYSGLDYSVPRFSLIQILERLIPPAARRDMAIQAHQEFLSARGVMASRTAKPKKSTHRVTTCVNCKRKFANVVELECAACHWLICKCGACGCAAKSNDGGTRSATST